MSTKETVSRKYSCFSTYQWLLSLGGNSDTLEVGKFPCNPKSDDRDICKWYLVPSNPQKIHQKLMNESSKCRKLDLNCVNIRAFLCYYQSKFVTFHFIPAKFGANNRVVWLSMVWLSGICCICVSSNRMSGYSRNWPLWWIQCHVKPLAS